MLNQFSHRTCLFFAAAVLPLAASAQVLEDQRIPILVDSSGSMQGDVDWLPRAIESMQNAVTERSLQLNRAPNFLLYGFSDQTERLGEGNAWDVQDAIAELRPTSGTEDGLLAVAEAIRDADLRNTTLVLITDEPRSEVRPVDMDALIANLRQRELTVHVLGMDTPACDDRPMLAIWGDGHADSPAGGFVNAAGDAQRCNGLSWVQGWGASARKLPRPLAPSYLALAQATGGSYWALQAFVDVPAVAVPAFTEAWSDMLINHHLAVIGGQISVSGVLRVGQPVTFVAEQVTHQLPNHLVHSAQWRVRGGTNVGYGDVFATIFEAPGDYEVVLELTDDATPANRVQLRRTVTITD